MFNILGKSRKYFIHVYLMTLTNEKKRSITNKYFSCTKDDIEANKFLNISIYKPNELIIHRNIFSFLIFIHKICVSYRLRYSEEEKKNIEMYQMHYQNANNWKIVHRIELGQWKFFYVIMIIKNKQNRRVW